MKKIVSSVLLIVGFFYIAKAQSITNIDFRQDGNAVIVSYKLNLPINKVANVELFVSSDAGKTFQGPLKAVSGDVGEIATEGIRTITWKVFEEFNSLDGDILFEVRANFRNIPLPKEKILFYNMSGTSAFGATYGVVRKWGWYLRLKSNGSFKFGDYTSNDSKLLDYDGEGYYTYTGEVARTRFGLTLGAIKRHSNNLYFYSGVGYGNRSLLWSLKEYSYVNDKELRDFWAIYDDRSFNGLEFEIGALYKIKKIGFSAGVNLVEFRFIEANIGVGVFF